MAVAGGGRASPTRRCLSLALIALSACAHQPSRGAPAGLSFAWVTFDSSGVTGSGAGGLSDRAGHRPATIDDPVRIASISKLVVALGVMRLVEQGRLDLDEDVSARLGWTLRNSAFPDRPISLRLLLSHVSSLHDGVEYAIPLGGDLRGVMSDPAAFDSGHPPGAFFHYSNLNFPVVASVMEKATGERFDRLIDRLVLKPLALDACFNWSTCRPATLARAVVLYGDDGAVLRDDLRGSPPPCLVAPAKDGSCELAGYVPGSNGALFSPQGGLRISARDLATIGRLLLNHGRHDGRTFLSERSIAALTTPLWTFDGGNGETEGGFYCAYGLAVQRLPVSRAACRDRLFGSRVMVGHAGDAYGVRSGLWTDPSRGVGIAFWAANNGSDPPRGRSAFRRIEERLAAILEARGRTIVP